ncbi:MAG TPA: hypothetical protein VHE10_01080 [Candidatus Paceibacterota bacterium]|nr:hypothetical protein [Candidatus Paceibacterota bacterium]
MAATVSPAQKTASTPSGNKSTKNRITLGLLGFLLILWGGFCVVAISGHGSRGDTQMSDTREKRTTSASPAALIPQPVPVGGMPDLMIGKPYQVQAGATSPWISIVGKWIHIVPADEKVTYELQDSNGVKRKFRNESETFYEVSADGKLVRLDDQTGRVWRKAVYARFIPDGDVTFTVDSNY